MAISYTPNPQGQQMPQPQAQPQVPQQPQAPQPQSSGFNLNVIPDCNTMDLAQLKQLRNYYRPLMQAREMILVKGTLEFRNHIVSPLDGDELAQENDRLASLNRLTHDRAGFHIQITNAEIIPSNPAQYTAAECLILAQMFKRRQNEYNPDPKPCWDFYTTATGRNPWIAIAEDDSMTKFKQVYPKQEPVAGTDVIVVLSTYDSTQQRGRVNLGLNGVLICSTDDARVFSSAASSAINRDATRLMQDRGILITPRPESTEESGVFDENSPEAQQMAESTRPFGEDAATVASVAQGIAPQQTVPVAEPAQPTYAAPAAQPSIPWAPAPESGGIVQ